MKNILTLSVFALLLHLHTNAAWISIKSFSVDTTANQIKINYSISGSTIGWFINKQDVYYSANQDTVNVRVFRLRPALAFLAPQIIDSSITITPNNFNQLCYLNFYNAADTNTVNPILVFEADGYDIDTAQYNFNHCAPLGINKQTLNNSIHIYPNPSSTNWVVDCGKDVSGTISYVITDVFGKTIYKNSCNASQFTIDHTNYCSGIYFLQVTVNGVSSAYQLIKL